jgi:hypothetical protein
VVNDSVNPSAALNARQFDARCAQLAAGIVHKAPSKIGNQRAGDICFIKFNRTVNDKTIARTNGNIKPAFECATKRTGDARKFTIRSERRKLEYSQPLASVRLVHSPRVTAVLALPA